MPGKVWPGRGHNRCWGEGAPCSSSMTSSHCTARLQRYPTRRSAYTSKRSSGRAETSRTVSCRQRTLRQCRRGSPGRLGSPPSACSVEPGIESTPVCWPAPSAQSGSTAPHSGTGGWSTGSPTGRTPGPRWRTSGRCGPRLARLEVSPPVTPEGNLKQVGSKMLRLCFRTNEPRAPRPLRGLGGRARATRWPRTRSLTTAPANPVPAAVFCASTRFTPAPRDGAEP